MTHARSVLVPEVIFWGGTGQAKVMHALLTEAGVKVVAVVDDTPNLPSPFADVPILHGREKLLGWLKGRRSGALGFLITIGNPHGRVRLKLHDFLVGEGLKPVTAVHPTAFVSPRAVIGPGGQIHAGAILETEVVLGRECIVNTKASVDHECRLDDGAEVAPGATLCGLVHVKTNGWVCTGATVLPRMTIGEDAIVGAGAVVTRSVPDHVTVVGIPAARRNS